MSIVAIEQRKLILRCDSCGCEFEKPNHGHIRRNRVHYHSKQCFDALQRKRGFERQIEARHKTCIGCDVDFCDIRRRISGFSCSRECMYEKMSKSRRENGSYDAGTLYSNCNRGFRTDLGQTFRSNWEANYARILELEGKKWAYEKSSFELDEGTYTPDFSVEGVTGFIELKGRIDDMNAMRKVNAFIIKYPDIPITLIGPTEYDGLRKRYKTLVLWEGK